MDAFSGFPNIARSVIFGSFNAIDNRFMSLDQMIHVIGGRPDLSLAGEEIFRRNDMEPCCNPLIGLFQNGDQFIFRGDYLSSCLLKFFDYPEMGQTQYFQWCLFQEL